MFGFFKRKLKCKHEWHYLADDYIYLNQGAYVDVDEGCLIFCIKCEKEDLVYKDKWEQIKRKQEIIRLHRQID